MGNTFEVTPEIQDAEFAWRDLARRHLADYGEYVLLDWVAHPVHRLLCEAMEGVYRYIQTKGAEGNGLLIIEMPPQGGKSTVAIKLFVSWLLGKIPSTRCLVATYSSELSTSHSEETQDIVQHERYAALFGERAYSEHTVEVSRDSSSKSFWRIKGHGGSLMATGVGGGAVGRSFDLVVIDDPYKNIQEALNREQRKKVSKWFKTSIISRRKKGTAIVLIHTRWHREDLIGEQIRLMADGQGGQKVAVGCDGPTSQVAPFTGGCAVGGDGFGRRRMQWEIVSIPAFPLGAQDYAVSEDEQLAAMKDGLYKPLCDPLGRAADSGVSYCPELFPVDLLETTRQTFEADGEPTIWSALYQQQPRPDEGVYFGRGNIKIIEADKLPQQDGQGGQGQGGQGQALPLQDAARPLQWYRYLDLALGKTKRADWNTCAAVAVDRAGNIYVRDMVRIHSFTDFVPVMKQVMKMDHEAVYGVESNMFQELAFRDFINDPELVGVAIFPVRATDDKESDARVVQARALAGKLYFVRGAWNEEAINELIEFPNGSHDDQVDTISRGVKMAFFRGGAKKKAKGWQG